MDSGDTGNHGRQAPYSAAPSLPLSTLLLLMHFSMKQKERKKKQKGQLAKDENAQGKGPRSSEAEPKKRKEKKRKEGVPRERGRKVFLEKPNLNGKLLIWSPKFS